MNVGWPVSVHDARVLVQSALYQNIYISENHLLDNPMPIYGVKIPLYLIGDSAYPLKSWLMKPFTHGYSLTTEQKTYNYRICRALIVVEMHMDGSTREDGSG